MKERIVSGIIMAIILVAILYIGGIAFVIGSCLLATGAFYELMKVKKDVHIPNIMKIVGLICMLCLLLIDVNSHTTLFGLSYETLSLVFLFILMPSVFLTKQKYRINDAFYLAAITIFLGTVFNLLISIYNESIYKLIFVILVACTTDIFALVGGRLIGKHKLTKISPKKTIEGSIVGTLVCTIIATTYYVTFISNERIVFTVLIIIVLSICGQIGDLFFSLIKRENDIKDYSNLIPGHGGILDRIDSIIFILIAFLVLMKFL